MSELINTLPKDKPAVLRMRTRPNEANPKGDIFGGWLMSQIDVAGGIVAQEHSRGPVVTVAVKELRFLSPLYVYDVVSFFAEITKLGKTSMTIAIEAYAERLKDGNIEQIKISDAILVYVAVSEPGVKRTL